LWQHALGGFSSFFAGAPGAEGETAGMNCTRPAGAQLAEGPVLQQSSPVSAITARDANFLAAHEAAMGQSNIASATQNTKTPDK